MASTITLTPAPSVASVMGAGNYSVSLSQAVVSGGGGGAPVVEPATCAMGDAIGAWVYVNASATDAGYQVTSADAGSQATCQCVGVIVSKPTPTATQCSIQRAGLTPDIFTGLVAGTRYFLGRHGAMVAPPISDTSIVYFQPLGVAVSPTAMLLTPQAPIFKRDA